MNRIRRNVLIFLCLCILVFSLPIVTAEEEEKVISSTPPVELQHKFRLGYSETDPYGNFAGTFYGLILGLAELGWLEGIEGLPYTLGQEDSYEMWQWLATRDVGPYLEFVEDAHYSLIEPGSGQQLMSRLREQQDLDLLIVLGTEAGQLTTSAEHPIPTMVFSTSNAVQAGIIKSPEDSGRDHVWAHTDAERYKRQIEVFHDIFNFKKLGIIYEDSVSGRAVAAVNDLKKAAEELDFELVSFHMREPKREAEYEQFHQDILEAHQDLAEEVDAYYLTAGITAGGLGVRRLPQLLQPFYDQGIPVFSQMGSSHVQHGALLSLYRAGFEGIGRFGAENMIRILQGSSARDLPQQYGDTPSIVINLAVAERIGYQAPFEILLVADEIFLEIVEDE